MIAAAGLPTQIKNVEPKAIINAHYRDKKFIGTVNRFVLLDGIGKTKIAENVPFNIIEFCVKARLAR
jgi:3-dehydroquinate synthetase